MGLGYFVTKALAGRGLAEKSQRRQLEKQYAQTAEDLRSVTSVSPEQPVPGSAASSFRSGSSYTDPLRTRLPTEGTLRRSRPTLERSQSDVCTRDSIPAIKQDALSTSGLTTQSDASSTIHREYSFTKVWEAETQNRRGLGRYTMSKNADPEHQMDHLRRAMSDLTPQMVRQLDNFRYSGTDPEIWDQYRKSRKESMTSSMSSQSSINTQYSNDHFDSKRSVPITRGFTSSLISPSSSFAGDEQSLHYRKDSNLSTTSSSSDGETKRRRRQGRQVSVTVSDNGTGSPLSTISENPDPLDKPLRKLERPCEFGRVTDNDSALASDPSDGEGTWMAQIKVTDKSSRLTQLVERNKKAPNEMQQLARARTRSNDRPQGTQSTKPPVDRSRTVKHVARPAIRRAQSHKRAKSKPAAIEIAKVCDTQEDVANNEGPESGWEILAALTGSDEADENPSDLSLYMDKARSKNGSKGQKSKTRESDDDNASIDSASTIKTLVPAIKRLVEAIPVHKRQRSATAFRIPLAACQPAKKAEESKPESSQATAH